METELKNMSPTKMRVLKILNKCILIRIVNSEKEKSNRQMILTANFQNVEMRIWVLRKTYIIYC